MTLFEAKRWAGTSSRSDLQSKEQVGFQSKQSGKPLEGFGEEGSITQFVFNRVQLGG